MDKSSVNLEFLFKPQRVAIVGFSLNPHKLGHLVYKNLISGGYRGKVFLVNPKGGSYQGLPIYPRLSDIPYPLDLAIIVIPAQFVPLVVEEAVEKRVKSLIVISAGFKEVGGRGKILEEKIKQLLEGSSTRLLGVNCLGLVSYGQEDSPLNATFLADMPPNGDVSFMSQSGAFGSAAVDWLLNKPLGFRYFASLGNKTDIDEVDLLDYFSRDKKTKIIAAYLESFNQGRKFVQLAARVTQHKPVILLTPGTSKRAQKAAISHTGSLVSDSQVVKIALEKAGIIQVTTIEEMFTYFLMFSLLQNKKIGRATAIVTNAGGPAIVVSDLLDRYGFTVPELELKTEEHLREVLPWEANVTDPIDVIGDADAERYKIALQAVVKDRNVDNIIVLLTPQITTQVKETAEFLVKLSRQTTKPIIASFIGGKRVEEGYKLLSAAGVPVFYFPDNALKALKAVYDYYHQSIKPLTFQSSRKVDSQLTKLAAEVDLLTLSGQQIDSYWFWQLLKKASLPVVPTKFLPLNDLKSLTKLEENDRLTKELEQIGETLKYPLVVKLAAGELSHRTDSGAVRLDIKDLSQFLKAVEDLTLLAKQLKLVHASTYLLIQHQVTIDYELIIGLKKDPNFGHFLMLGGGGIQAELYRDVTSLLLPTSRKEIEEKFSETKIYRLLTGYRGGYKYNLRQIVETVLRLTSLSLAAPWLKVADFNPLIVNKKGVFIVDAKGYKE